MEEPWWSIMTLNKQKLFIIAFLLQMMINGAPALAAPPPPPKPGVGQGGTPFNAGDDEDLVEFEDEEEEFEEEDSVSQESMRQRLQERLQTKPGNNEAPSIGGGSRQRDSGVDFNRAGEDIGATTIGQGAASQIQAGQNSSCLKLDPFTGYGPDIVTNFDFPDADIVEIAKTLGRLTCLNFILDKDVKGRISVVSNAPITIGDAWKAFLTSLDVNGFSIIPSGKYLRIAKQRDARDKQIRTYTGKFAPDNDLYITRVIQLKYINADEAARVFRNFLPPNSRMLAYDQTNTLIVTDTAANIKKVADMIEVLDVESFDEKLEVISIRNAASQDIARLIDQLLPGGGRRPTGAPTPGVPRFGTAAFAARKTKEGGVISHVIPDDRTNSIIVSANGKGLEQIRQLVKKLDSKVTGTPGGSKIHVVYLQFADAEQTAQTLNNLTSGAGTTPGRTQVMSAPGFGGPATTPIFEGAIKIAPDKATNSLVITGTPTDFQTINRVISKLDVPRDQVYVESIIMEMQMNKNFELSTNIANPSTGLGFNPTGDLKTMVNDTLGLSGLALGFKSGGSTTIRVPGPSGAPIELSVPNLFGLIRAIQTNSNGNVLATPQLLTLDNQEAKIEISEEIPVPTVNQVAGVGSTTSISRQNVGLTLTIKPQINKISNFVKLNIKQKLQNVGERVPSELQGKAFSTVNRESETTVVVQDGDTVALGGLMKDNVTKVTNKVPILGDIPILGWLFRSTKDSVEKTNLIAFITPKIIKQYQEIRQVLDKKIRQRDEFLEKNNGGEDPHLDFKKDILKNLPQLGDLRSNERVNLSKIGQQKTENSGMNNQLPTPSDSLVPPMELEPTTPPESSEARPE